MTKKNHQQEKDQSKFG
uniref:Uncharacterized protein n=1 Tax=Arundo donax TaxID=35708 RepID=A0A0A9DNW4_ARUDO